MAYRIPISQPDLSGNEEAYVVDAIRSTWISSSGEFVDRFEIEFAKACESLLAVSVCNGTAALHLVMLALGVGPGDEVIVPHLTYVATANAVRYVGATPVFADVDPETWCIAPEAIERAITSRTKGIIPVHLYGVVADMDAINRLAAIHGLWVVEDAAEAFGASYHGVSVGRLARAGVFSFYGNKILTSGEGGAIAVNDPSLDIRLRTLRGQGVDPARRYYHPVIGYNFRLTNVACALLCAQLERAPQMLKRRHEIMARYRVELEPDGFVAQRVPEHTTASPWLATFRAPSSFARQRIFAALEQHGIETRPVFVPLSQLPPYRDGNRSPYGASQAISDTGFSLPTYVGLTDEQIEEICDLIVAAAT
jgi:perosamine synthetase